MVGDPKKSRTSLISDCPFFAVLDVLFWSGYQSQVISIHINPIGVVFVFKSSQIMLHNTLKGKMFLCFRLPYQLCRVLSFALKVFFVHDVHIIHVIKPQD